MKLFILAALIAVSSAARLEHLERGYLPPDQANQGQGFGGAQGHGNFGAPSHGFGNQGSAGFGANNADSSSFGSSPVGTKSGASAFHRGSSLNAATSNQYLPPNHGPSSNGFSRPQGGGHSQGAFGASSNQNQFSVQPNSQYGAPQFGQGSSGSGSQGSNSFGSQGSHGSSGFGSQSSSGFGSQGSNSFGSQGSHGSSGFGSQSSSGFGSQGSNGFGSQGSNGFRSQGSRFDTSRQYLAPKASSSFDKIPQQSFDEETGYHY